MSRDKHALLDEAIRLRSEDKTWAQVEEVVNVSRQYISIIAHELNRNAELIKSRTTQAERNETRYKALIGTVKGRRKVLYIKEKKSNYQETVLSVKCLDCDSEYDLTIASFNRANKTRCRVCIDQGRFHIAKDHVGQIFGAWRIDSLDNTEEGRQRRVNVTCLKCNTQYLRQFASIRDGKQTGCTNCRNKPMPTLNQQSLTEVVKNGKT